MNFHNESIKYSNIKQDTQLAELYSTLYTIPRSERVKILMSWLANAYSDLLIPFLSETDVLDSFTAHVRLLDTFANNSSYDVVAQLVSEFSDNFLKAQVLPNLLENYERTADVTFYIQTICENLTCPSLIRKMMDVVTSELSPILISRMRSENQTVATSTLSLIKTLLEFYCEDLWYELILQYLLPMKHLLTSQRQKMLPDIEFHESTQKLVDFVPKHVTDTIKPSILAEHFLLYFQDETMRLRKIDSAVASSLPSSRSELQKVGMGISKDLETEPEVDIGNDMNGTETRKSGCNITYPMWIFHYDGTDFLHALRRGYIQEEPEEFFEDDLFSVTSQLNLSSAPTLDEDTSENDSGFVRSRSEIPSDGNNFELRSVSATEDFTRLNENEPTSSIETDAAQLLVQSTFTSIDSIVKDKRRSFDNLEESDRYQNAYFGPFLNAIYEILRKWTEVDPNVLFTVTEIVSVLASSRIPLVNSLFLDMNLTLQPSFPSFPALLHGIRNELDEKMKKYPDFVFRNVWRSAAQDCTISGVLLNSKEEFDDDERDKSGFVSALKRTISSNRSFRMAAEELQKTVGIGRRSSSFRTFADIFKGTAKAASPGTSRESRLLNRAADPFENEEEENCAKTMALRSVLFSHWMLELAAIALELCWGRKSFHGRDDVRIAPEVNEDREVNVDAET